MSTAETKRERLTRPEIQIRIDNMWKKLFPRETPDTWRYPVKRIAEELILRGWIELVTNQTLPLAGNGAKIWGRFSWISENHPRYTIYVDRSLSTLDERFAATLAHEIGHLVLHRNLVGKGEHLSTAPYPSTAEEIRRFGKMASLSDRQWVEWQADEFMAALILPAEGLFDRVVKIQKEMGILRRGFIRLDHQPCNQIDAANIIAKIAVESMIEKPIVESRLRYLNILQDVRGQERLYRGTSVLDILATSSSKGERLFDFPIPKGKAPTKAKLPGAPGEETTELWSSERFTELQPTRAED